MIWKSLICFCPGIAGGRVSVVNVMIGYVLLLVNISFFWFPTSSTDTHTLSGGKPPPTIIDGHTRSTSEGLFVGPLNVVKVMISYVSSSTFFSSFLCCCCQLLGSVRVGLAPPFFPLLFFVVVACCQLPAWQYNEQRSKEWRTFCWSFECG